MNRWEIKAAAKNRSVQNLWLMVGVYLLYSIITTVATVYVKIGFIFTGIFAFGWATLLLRVMRRDNAGVMDLFSAFSENFVRSFLAGILQTLYLLGWTLLFFIPGIVKSYSYSMTYFIMNDDKNVGANEAITKSREMMNGHKMELFVLDLSFIGWLLLSVCTFGILLFWVVPYMNLAHAEFYRRLKGEDSVVVEVENSNNNEASQSAEW